MLNYTLETVPSFNSSRISFQLSASAKDPYNLGMDMWIDGVYVWGLDWYADDHLLTNEWPPTKRQVYNNFLDYLTE